MEREVVVLVELPTDGDRLEKPPVRLPAVARYFGRGSGLGVAAGRSQRRTAPVSRVEHSDLCFRAMEYRDFAGLVDAARAELSGGVEAPLSPEDTRLLVEFVMSVSTAFAFAGGFEQAHAGFDLALAAAREREVAPGANWQWDLEASILHRRAGALYQARRYPEAIAAYEEARSRLLDQLEELGPEHARQFKGSLENLDRGLYMARAGLARGRSWSSPRLTDTWSDERFAKNLAGVRTWWRGQLGERASRAEIASRHQASSADHSSGSEAGFRASTDTSKSLPERRTVVARPRLAAPTELQQVAQKGASKLGESQSDLSVLWSNPKTRSLADLMAEAQEETSRLIGGPLDREEIRLLVEFAIGVSSAFASGGSLEDSLAGLDFALAAAKECGVETMYLYQFEDVEITILSRRCASYYQYRRYDEAAACAEARLTLLRERSEALLRDRAVPHDLPRQRELFEQLCACVEQECQSLRRRADEPGRFRKRQTDVWSEERFAKRMRAVEAHWRARLQHHIESPPASPIIVWAGDLRTGATMSGVLWRQRQRREGK